MSRPEGTSRPGTRAQGAHRGPRQGLAVGESAARADARITRSSSAGNPPNPGASFARVAALHDLLAEEFRKLAAHPEDRLADVPNQSGHDPVVMDQHERRDEERVEAHPDLLAAAEVARLLHCDVRTLRRMRLEGRAPTSIMVGKRPRWLRAEVEAWIATRKETR